VRNGHVAPELAVTFTGIRTKAAALMAGEAVPAPITPTSALSRPRPKERTWADFEVKDLPTAAKPVVSNSLPPALLEKIRQQNAMASAAAQADREAAGKRKPTPIKRTQRVKPLPKPKGPPKGSRNHSKLTAAQVAEIWSSLESGVALARRYGVSAMTISSIRSGKLWGSLTVTLGESGLKQRREVGAVTMPADSQQASKDLTVNQGEDAL
jgi:hypothetical protein